MEASPSANITRLPLETQTQKQKVIAILVSVSLIPFVLLYLKFGTLWIVVGLMAVIVTVWAVAFSIQNTLILLFAYISFLPNLGWGSRYSFFKGLYFGENIVLLFLLPLFVWYLGEELLGKKSHKSKFSTIDWTIFIFLILTFLAALRGGFENGNFVIIKLETFFLCCYAFYFLYTSRLTLAQIETCWKVFIIITTAVSIEFILLTLSEGGPSIIFVDRITTQQPNIAQLGFPLLASYLFFKNSWPRRLLAVVLMLPIFPMVFFSQQRALWVGLVFSLFILSGFAFLKDQFSLARVIKFIFISLAVLLLMIGMIFVLDKYVTGSVLLTAFERIQSLGALSIDKSANIRLSEIIRALGRWQASLANIIFGTGFGDTYESVDPGRINTYAVDNSYVLILWKMGIMGLATYLLMSFLVLRSGFYVFTHTTSEKHKQLTAALISGLFGLAVIALTNYCLVRYRFIIIWSLVIATIEILRRRVENEQKSIVSAGKR